MYLRSVVVTGCSRGLGLELVKQLALISSCCKIIASCRNPEEANYLKQIESDKVLIKKLDVDDIDSFENFAEEIKNDVQDSGVTCLINNAGVAPKATRYNLVKVEQMESTFRTNVIAPLFLTKAMIPLLKKNSQSLTVNMSSILGSIENNQKVSSGGAGGGQYPYRSTKAALNMVTRSLSIDLEHAKIGAIAIHPGWVQTDMGGKYASLTPEESIKGVLNVITNYNSKQHNGQFLDFNGESVSW